MSRRKAERRGRAAEWAAIVFLIGKGYRILGHRLRTPYGEVDIAAWKSGVLVIAEVKARATYDAGAYAVTAQAQDRIARAASALAGRWRLSAAPRRYDIIVVDAGWLPRHERGAWFDQRLGA